MQRDLGTDIWLSRMLGLTPLEQQQRGGAWTEVGDSFHPSCDYMVEYNTYHMDIAPYHTHASSALEALTSLAARHGWQIICGSHPHPWCAIHAPGGDHHHSRCEITTPTSSLDTALAYAMTEALWRTLGQPPLPHNRERSA